MEVELERSVLIGNRNEDGPDLADMGLICDVGHPGSFHVVLDFDPVLANTTSGNAQMDTRSRQASGRGAERPAATARPPDPLDQAAAWASSHSASDVKPTITASIQYCERTASRGSR